MLTVEVFQYYITENKTIWSKVGQQNRPKWKQQNFEISKISDEQSDKVLQTRVEAKKRKKICIKTNISPLCFGNKTKGKQT